MEQTRFDTGEIIDDEDEDDDGEGDEDEEDNEEEVKEEVKEEPKQIVPIVRTVINKKVDSLEDLYALFPELNSDERTFFLRLTRLLPKRFGTTKIDGDLIDTYEKIITDDIKASYGGGTYLVSVMGPAKGEPDGNGNFPVRTHKSFRVEIPGMAVPHVPVEPIPVGSSSKEKDMSMRTPGIIGSVPMVPGIHTQQVASSEPPAVQLERIKQEERRETKVDERSERAAVQSNEAMRQSLAEIRTAAELHANDLKSQINHYFKENNELKKESALLKDERSTHKAEAEIAKRIHDSIVAEREQFRNELLRVKDEVRITNETNERRFRDESENLRRRFDDDRNKIEKDASLERQRLSEDHRSREQSLRDETERRCASIKDQYEGRIQDLERSTKRELDSVREQRDNTITTVKATTQMEVTSIKSQVEAHNTLLVGECERLRREVATLKSECKQLEIAARPKDPVQYLGEVRDTAVNLLGMVHSSEIPVAGAEEEMDWKKMGAKIFMNLVDKAPEMIGQVGQMRAQSAAARQGQPQQQQRRGVPQQDIRRAMTAAPPSPWSNGVMAPIREVPTYAPVPGMQPQGQAEQQQVPTQSTYQPPPIVSFNNQIQAYQNQGIAQEQQVSVQNPIQQVAQQQGTAPLQGIPPEQAQALIEEFIGMLHQSIHDEVIPPGIFAQSVIQKIGPDQARDLLQKVTPETLFQSVEKFDTAITTRDGRKYTNEVWVEAKKILGI